MAFGGCPLSTILTTATVVQTFDAPYVPFRRAIGIAGVEPDSVALMHLGDICKRKAEMSSKISKVYLAGGDSDLATSEQVKSNHLYEDALDWYTRAVSEDPCNSWALGHLAGIHLLHHRHGAAEEKYKQAVAVDPAAGFALSGLVCLNHNLHLNSCYTRRFARDCKCVSRRIIQ